MSAQSGACARRRNIIAGLSAGIAACLLPAHTLAQSGGTPARALREMQIHRVPQLGLEIWVENQPPWDTHVSHAGGRPSFIAEAPAGHHPPAVMTYASWPKQRIAPHLLGTTAVTAIRRASRNFGLSVAQSRSVSPQPASHGVLEGYEAHFTGEVQGVSMDVRIFIGQDRERFPVVLTLYTPSGKIDALDEHVRRAWGRLNYLAATTQTGA